MEALLLICKFATFLLAVAGAPYTSEEEHIAIARFPEEFHQQELRPGYGQQYITPCAAANSIRGYGTRGYNQFQLPGYGGGIPQYGIGSHYRAAEEQTPEMLSFSDMDRLHQDPAQLTNHMPMARNSFGAPFSPISSGYGLNGLNGPYLNQGPAYGVFPNANVGGCNVPLLFSCSPSISSGRIVESQGHYGAGGSQFSGAAQIAGGNAYRLVEQPRHEVHEHEHSEEISSSHHEESVHESGQLQAHT